MRKNNYFLSVLICGLICISMIGCSSSQNQQSSSEAEQTIKSQYNISMGTAGIGGAYYVMGGAMANLVNEKLDNIKMTAEVTDGASQNLEFVSKGEMDIAMGGAQVVRDAYEGTGVYSSKLDIRGVAVIHPSIIHIVASKSSGIKKIEDMKGKRVAVGAPGSAARFLIEDILKVHGLSFEDIKVFDLSYVEAISAMKDNNIDAIWGQTGVPTSAFLDLCNSVDVEFIPISENTYDGIKERWGHLVMSFIPKDVYKNNEDIPAIAAPNIMFCATSIDEEVIYQVTKCIFENLDELKKSHVSFELIDINNAPTKTIPLHPGAERYFKEVGVL